jgi:MerR family transcriptional regulator/heat shock protein HspR
MREKITALARYDGSSPEQVMRGLLSSGKDHDA